MKIDGHWRPAWEGPRPHGSEKVLFGKESWEHPMYGTFDGLNPDMDITGIYWKRNFTTVVSHPIEEQP